MKDRVIDMTELAKEEEELCAKVPVEDKLKAAEFLRGVFSENDVKKFRELYSEKEGGRYWFSSYHFFGGMTIRNNLRKGGFGEEFFGFNLDYIYVELIEIAIGVRDCKKEECS